MTLDLIRERDRRARPGRERFIPRAETGGAPAFVGRVVTGGSPGAFVTVNPVTVTGTESAGSAGSMSIDTDDLTAVLLVGSAATAANDYLICRFVGHRWVAQRGTRTASTHTLAGCTCTAIPNSIHMSFDSDSPSNNFVFPATLSWQLGPPDIHPYNTQYGYWSSSEVTSKDGVYALYYQFDCFSGTYGLVYWRRVIANGGPPYSYTAFTFMNYIVGFPGNTCSPFSLHHMSTTDPVYTAMNIKVDG